MKTCSTGCRIGSTACPTPWGYATDGRTPVRDPQGLDGRHPLPDPDPRQGPNRDELPRPGLQPQANDLDVRCGTADGGDQDLIASLKLLARVCLSASALAPGKHSVSTGTSDAFSHGLGHEDPFALPTLNGRSRVS